MLETVREFAQERLTASEEEGRLRHAHAQYFLALAEQADTQIETTPDILPGLEQGQTDHDNLRAALTTFIAEQDTDGAQRLAGALGLFWYHRGFWSEGRAWLERVLDLPESATPATRAKALCRFGLFAHVQGDEERAVAAFQAGLAFAQSINDRAGVANAQFLLGFVAIDAGDYESATHTITSALAFYQETGDPFWIAMMQMQLGVAAAGRGAVAEAERYLDDALTQARAIGDAWNEAVIHGERGWLLCERGAFREAAASLERSVRALHDMNCVHDLCRFLPYLAGLLAASGHVDDAARVYGGIAGAYARLGFTPKPVERARTEAFLTAIRATLGEEAFTAAWNAGQALRWSDLVEDALSLAHGLATEDRFVTIAAVELP